MYCETSGVLPSAQTQSNFSVFWTSCQRTRLPYVGGITYWIAVVDFGPGIADFRADIALALAP